MFTTQVLQLSPAEEKTLSLVTDVAGKQISFGQL